MQEPIYQLEDQRWATMLLNCFTIEYLNTKDFGQVDALSRLITSPEGYVIANPSPEDYVIANVDVDVTAEIDKNC
ncbi:unnamed protein product [Nippostrongylus brasiliensis]|uniref:Acetyltransferase n=1 Tax=Nippostrongylus brasiliensis TaxID=27835 RepID=A0A0N4YJB5_NIPBR|nr:unnamed protein product [Nippostrongylus brasiliensis]